jgi:hypothetical protein
MPDALRQSTLLLVAITATAFAQTRTSIVRPREINGVLVNPGMGITTFQRFNGQGLNPELKWSEEGPATPISDEATRPEFPESSIATPPRIALTRRYRGRICNSIQVGRRAL